jgi:hypothetical protein
MSVLNTSTQTDTQTTETQLSPRVGKVEAFAPRDTHQV